MKLEIDTYDASLIYDLFPIERQSMHTEYKATEGSAITFDGRTLSKVYGVPETMNFNVKINSKEQVANFVEWLFPRVKQKAISVRLNKRIVDYLDKDMLKRKIEDEYNRILE
jgi:hypothetical protein|nr:hypothetical protein [Nanoarchaeum sp.]